MNGQIISRTPIAVDFWKPRLCPQAKVFFLSHLHADHTDGLTSTWRRMIHCSEVTAKLLHHRFGISMQYIKGLELDVPHIVYLDASNTQIVNVTLIDANHCPGAVMFLFEGYFGVYLYTADFRYDSKMLKDGVLSKMCFAIDKLYLDNTYCKSDCEFPTKQECKEQIIDIIIEHPAHDVVIAVRKLGKENLLVDIALTLQERIVVSHELMKQLEILELPDVFTTDLAMGRIRVVPFKCVTSKNVKEWNASHPTIAIIPSGLFASSGIHPRQNNKMLFNVPYSDHSSYSELCDFLMEMKPKMVIPIIKYDKRGPFGEDVSDRANMERFDRFLSHDEPLHEFTIPSSVKLFMTSQSDNVLASNNKNCLIGGKKFKSKSCANRQQKSKLSMGVIYENSPLKSQIPNKITGETLHNDHRKAVNGNLSETKSVSVVSAVNLQTDDDVIELNAEVTSYYQEKRVISLDDSASDTESDIFRQNDTENCKSEIDSNNNYDYISSLLSHSSVALPHKHLPNLTTYTPLNYSCNASLDSVHGELIPDVIDNDESEVEYQRIDKISRTADEGEVSADLSGQWLSKRTNKHCIKQKNKKCSRNINIIWEQNEIHSNSVQDITANITCEHKYEEIIDVHDDDSNDYNDGSANHEIRRNMLFSYFSPILKTENKYLHVLFDTGKKSLKINRTVSNSPRTLYPSTGRIAPELASGDAIVSTSGISNVAIFSHNLHKDDSGEQDHMEVKRPSKKRRSLSFYEDEHGHFLHIKKKAKTYGSDRDFKLSSIYKSKRFNYENESFRTKMRSHRYFVLSGLTDQLPTAKSAAKVLEYSLRAVPSPVFCMDESKRPDLVHIQRNIVMRDLR